MQQNKPLLLKPLVIGNWKMHGLRASLAEARAIDRAAARLSAVVGIAPPFTLVAAMAEACRAMLIGGQNCHARPNGAHTGEVSAAMLHDAGARFVILGHSERRADNCEDDALVRAKTEAALAAQLSVVLCVGETAAERDAGRAEALVAHQLRGSLPACAPANGTLSIAYEPVWAIGTGRVPSVGDISAMHRAIREILVATYGDAGRGVRILYGGSVNAGNAATLLAADEVGGALVGGASLTAESFGAIITAAALLADSAG